MTSRSEEAEQIKELGDKEFKQRNFRQAIKCYTKALECVCSTTPIEMQRCILANRAQAYSSYGVIYEALRDVNRVVSTHFTKEDSPKALTAKSYCLRAKVLCTMARYDEAHAAYAEFANLANKNEECTLEEIELKEEIDRGAQASEDSDRWLKDRLMRAVDARGFILRPLERETFPLPPPGVLEDLGPDFDPEEGTLQFATDDRKPNRELPDSNLTPISLPFYIRAPYFKPNPTSTRPFSTRLDPTSEDETVQDVVGNLFTSLVIFSGHTADRETMFSALDHEDDRGSVVLVFTSRGRILEIPRNTKVKDIIAGARWPRPGRKPKRLAFNDLRTEPRVRSGIDGIELFQGWVMDLNVVPRDKLREFVGRMEHGFKDFGIC